MSLSLDGRFISLPFIFLGLLFTSGVALAEDSASEIQVQATVDRNEMSTLDELNLRVTVTARGERVEIGDPRLPSLDGFDLIHSSIASSTSSNLTSTPQGLRFQTTRSQVFNYRLRPQMEGRLAIEPFEVVVDGTVYRTEPMSILVVEGSSQTAPDPQDTALRDENEDLFTDLLQRRQSGGRGYRSEPRNPNEAFFVRVEIDKLEVYEGEQIIVNWYIYTRGVIESLERLKFPDLRGFWKEDIDPAPALNFTQVVINGIPYRRALLASHAIFPLHTGEAIIDDYKLKASVRLPSNALGSFGFGRPYVYTRTSEEVRIQVNPLPTEGRPADFTGAVGNFNVSGQVEGSRFEQHQPFVYRLRFEGEGNAKLIELPSLDLPSSIEYYDSRSDSDFHRSGRSFREFEILLIPREAGEVIIPAMGVSVFDPELGQYLRRETSEIRIDVAPAQRTGGLAESRRSFMEDPDTETARLPDPVMTLAGGGLPRIPTDPLPWSAAFALAGVVLFVRARRQLRVENSHLSFQARVSERFARARSLLNQGETRAVGKEVTNAIYITLGEISGQGGAHSQFDQMMETAPPSVRRELAAPLKEALSTFEMLTFAPKGSLGALKDTKEVKAQLDQAEKLMLRAVQLQSKGRAS